MRALLVVNPRATGTTSRTRDVLARALGSDLKVDVAMTARRGHATDLAREAAADELDHVVVLGGDGTVNEVVNGLVGGGPTEGLPTLSVVPTGCTNVFARTLGFSTDPVEATGQILESLRLDATRVIGLGRADERWFTFCGGLGFDAEVVRRVDRARRDGRGATPGMYVRKAVGYYFGGADRRHPPLTLAGGGLEAPQRLAVALVCNTSPWTYLGARPVQPTPGASYDNRLDVFGLRRLRTVDTLRQLRRMFSEAPRLRGRNVLSLHDVDAVTVTAEGPVALQVDGESLGEQESVTFRAHPAALRVLVAPGQPA